MTWKVPAYSRLVAATVATGVNLLSVITVHLPMSQRILPLRLCHARHIELS